MIVKIKGFGDAVYALVANDIVKAYLKVAFWISPFAIWKLYELAEKYLMK